MAVGTLEEIIDDNHAIVSTSVGSEYYVNILSFVDKDLIEPGCTVLLNSKVSVHERSVRLLACRVFFVSLVSSKAYQYSVHVQCVLRSQSLVCLVLEAWRVMLGRVNVV